MVKPLDLQKPRSFVFVTMAMGFYDDNWISKRMQEEKQIRDSLKEIDDPKAALYEHTVVAITALPGKITHINNKFRAISRFSRKEPLGQDHHIINSNFHPKEFICNLWTTITHANVWTNA